MKKIQKIFIFITILTFYQVFLINNQTMPEQKSDNKKEIIFGQSIYETGTLKLYGDLIKQGILSCFNKINEKGGIKGKQLKLVSMDDKGHPAIAEKNVKTMLSKNKIDMFIGNMGTRSLLKILPLVKTQKIALLFPWGGDEELRSPNLTHIINGPGLLKPQIEAIIYEIVDNMKLTKIAILHDDSDFYKKIAQEAIAELKKYNLTPIKVESFNRVTMNIDPSADSLIQDDPRVIIALCTNTPTVKLINRFFEKGCFGTTFFGTDSTFFVGQILHEKGANFYYASAIPDPTNVNMPIVKEYQEALYKSFPLATPNTLSLTYYICAKIIVDALQKIDGTITKEKLIEQIEKMQKYNLGNGGFIVDFNPNSRQAFGYDISIIKG
jgi:branched-chain amino acid transport system substrate-binding protein